MHFLKQIVAITIIIFRSLSLSLPSPLNSESLPLLLPFESQDKITNSTSTKTDINVVNDLNPNNESGSGITNFEYLLELFASDCSHSYNLVIYGGSRTNTTTIQKQIQKHRRFGIGLQITSAIITDHSEHPFKNVLASCLQTFHLENKIILYIQPDDIEQTQDILKEINAFYKEIPSKSSTIYFFISWPPGPTANVEFLRSLVFNNPIDSHFYILPKEIIKTNNNNYHQALILPNWPSYENQKQYFFEYNWIVWEFYHMYGHFIYEPVSRWWDFDDFHYVVRRRRNFRGATVRALVQQDVFLPLLTIFKNNNGTLEFQGGLSYDMLLSISATLNISLKILQGSGWIREESNGSLLGMGSQLLGNVADFSMSYSELLEFRLGKLAASHPSAEMEVNAYYQKPPPGFYRDIYLQAFSPALWALVVATWLVIIPCLIIFSMIIKRYSQEGCSQPDEMIASDALCWAVGAACQTGWHYTPTSTSLQIIFVCGLVSGLVYYTAYSASIISIFSVELNPFLTIKDLVKHGFKLYGNEASWTGQFLIESQATADGETFESRLIDITAALDKIEHSRAAYVITREYFFTKAVEQNNSYTKFCSLLSKLPGHIGRLYNVWYFRKFDPLRKYLDLQLTRWRQMGLSFRLNMDHARTLPAPCDQKKKEAIPLEIQDVQSAFIILAAGFISCICVLCLEIIFKASRVKEKVITWPHTVLLCHRCQKQIRRKSA